MEIDKLHKIFLDSKGVTTDTRKVEKGQLFFALKGDNFNGNQFANDALGQGAAFAIIDEPEYKNNEKCILVKNVLLCLQELACFHRKFLGIPIIAITGTNGKTTSKELISAVLQKKFNVSYTKGNFNNHIGVPLTLLSFNKQTEIGVVEMGANHIGEIEALCKIAQPDYGLITNIGKAHLEGFGSYEGVIKAKTELFNHLKAKNSKIFINADDNVLMANSQGIERITYGKESSFFCSAEFIEASPFIHIKWKSYIVNSQLVGEYNFYNLVLAITVGNYFNVDEDHIVKAIQEYKPDNNRSQLLKTGRNILIVDAYNANPSSMDLSVRNFRNIKNDDKLLILGDMFELGEKSSEEHQKILDLVILCGFENAIFVGKNFYALRNDNYHKIVFLENTQKLIDYITDNQLKNKTILLKASRGVQLEKVIPYL